MQGGNAISLENLWVLFTRTVWTGDFVLQDELVHFPFAKNTLNDSFSFPLVFHKLFSASLKSSSDRCVLSLPFP